MLAEQGAEVLTVPGTGYRPRRPSRQNVWRKRIPKGRPSGSKPAS